MAYSIANNHLLRKNFAKIKNIIDIPNLIDIQKNSYHRFLQQEVAPESRKNIGLEAVFRSVFPIKDFSESASLEYVSYTLNKPKYDVEECHQRGMTFAAPMKVKVRLVIWESGKETGVRAIKDIKEQEVYFGEIPLMTDNGTFIINGTERVIVSQLHRSPGVFYDHDKGKTHSSGKVLYSARVIPYRGSWLDFEFDHKDILYVRIDRRRKMPATVLLKALGYSVEQLLNYYYSSEEIFVNGESLSKSIDPELLTLQKSTVDVVDPKNGEVIVKANRKYTKASIKKLFEHGIKTVPVAADGVIGRYASADVIDPATGEILVECNEEVTAAKFDEIVARGVRSFSVLFIDNLHITSSFRDTLLIDKVSSTDEALIEIYRRLRPGDPPTLKSSLALFDNLFFNPERYDLSAVGRLKLNYKLGLKVWPDCTVLNAPSMLAVEDFLNPQELVSRLVKGEDQFSQYLMMKLPAELVKTLKKCDLSQPVPEKLVEQLVQEFNNLFKDHDFFQKDVFAPLPLGAATVKLSELIDQGVFDENRRAIEILRRNRMLFEDLYADLIAASSKNDILEIVRYLIDLKNGRGTIDDIDHLGNRRVRAVGELLENQYRIGLVRMERAIKERMSLQEVENLMPHDLINSKPVSAVVKEFFGSSQLSQFMDQTNPLSEVTHKRRLSALGPGGLTRERAGFEVRDVHPTHYGRVCPIETPEGPNIGLIASLSTYARINEHGFVETPYRIVEDGKLTSDVRFFSALEEEGHAIAQANAEVDKNGRFVNDYVTARKSGEFILVHREEIELMDVAPKQLVSVAAALIPFLENDDANRALMGSNMQRQAVPLLRADSPLVGTGMERIVAKDSGVSVIARHKGEVESVDASRIVIKIDDDELDETGTGVDIYNMIKFARSNQNTCINNRPVVKVGDKIKRGDVIADGPSTDMGELALGQNIVVAFMPWGGYNYEDSILVSEKMVKEDRYTSIHIEEFECVARDTKLGKEEITSDIPNLGEETLKDLDESGIIRIGAEVRPGDILVGKITPKGETQLSPEEKLLRAIFGEKAGDVRDTSLTVPPGVEGTVIGAKIFSRKGNDKDARTELIEKAEENKLRKDEQDEIRIIRDSAVGKLKRLLVGKTLAVKLEDGEGMLILAKGKKITEETLDGVAMERWAGISVSDEGDTDEKVSQVLDTLNRQIDLIHNVFDDKIQKLKRGDDLPPGVIKMVKVYIAIKRKLQVGDKMAGRHGNKGVVSRILPEEDMPYMEDGRPVEIVLNPLGVPSRMNVGQIIETHLGWAAKGIGWKIEEMLQKHLSEDNLKAYLKDAYDDADFTHFIDTLDQEELLKVCRRLQRGIPMASPVFEGASENKIKGMLKKAGFHSSGQVTLFDGRTGDPFKHKVTVGVMYFLKLHHLVDDKIHARSIGPYSLVTQQPLGGKAQFGGQRLGEMEVWAMEAYGASYALQEFLTVKSDDVSGRTRMYEAIVKGKHTLEPGLPESFNVLIKELQSLCLDVELLEGDEE
ncbi:DNA-directed RNA polymerase subunit beta [Oryzomonas sagensis]|uniref:DNA-directed RNA polymerase subunit beta n=1 Tax=Oryzomonas sagensis TaxID=2603857 RepID=A0ABQ6TJQ8_9BACT|nr:DNA-directed RNA polymerase subunit beta [Oryzomonas sagensis]KAB0668113.1 DNA-directed RNA polymerase subunit beta [Oryzomonas sagensis]